MLLDKLNDVYDERNKVIALAATLAARRAYRTWLAPASDAEPGWTYVVYIDLPSGQVSWHLPDNILPLFAELPRYEAGQTPPCEWDGHDTETKYRRVCEYALPTKNAEWPIG